MILYRAMQIRAPRHFSEFIMLVFKIASLVDLERKEVSLEKAHKKTEKGDL